MTAANAPTSTLLISSRLCLPLSEITLTAVRAQGAGGQNVNKVASAVHLRFDISGSSLPDSLKQSLLALTDRRASADGIIVIKAQQFRTQERNREDALERLAELIRRAAHRPKPRKPTEPSARAKAKRVDAKIHRGRIKSWRTRTDSG